MSLLIVGLIGAASGIAADRFARPFLGRVWEAVRKWIVWKLTGTQA
jgi:hypothetical protein